MKHKKGTWVIALQDYGSANYWRAGDIGEIVKVEVDNTYLVNFYNATQGIALQGMGVPSGWWTGEYDVEEIDEATAKALLIVKGFEL